MVFHKKIPVPTGSRTCWIDISEEVADAVASSGIENGLCTVVSLHTTAGLTVNENADPDVGRDVISALNALVPRDRGYRHAEGNSDAHIKASLVGLSVQIPVTNGTILLGTWQSIYFCEFDGPRSRQVSVTVMGE